MANATRGETRRRHCLRVGETSLEGEIVSAMRRQLFWTHVKTLAYTSDALKRQFCLGYTMGLGPVIHDPDRVLLAVHTNADQKGSSRIDNKQTINKARLDNKSGIMSNLDNNKTLKDCSSLNSSARRVYMAIAEDPFMTQQGLASKLDLSRATIAAATATLIKLNFIRREGSKKTGHWEVIDEAAEGK